MAQEAALRRRDAHLLHCDILDELQPFLEPICIRQRGLLSQPIPPQIPCPFLQAFYAGFPQRWRSNALRTLLQMRSLKEAKSLLSETLRHAIARGVHDDSIHELLSHCEPKLADFAPQLAPACSAASSIVVPTLQVPFGMPRASPHLGSSMQLPFEAHLDVASLEKQIWFTTLDMRSLTLVSKAYHRWVEDLAQETLLTCDTSRQASPESSDSNSEPDKCCLGGIPTATSLCGACERDCRQEC